MATHGRTWQRLAAWAALAAGINIGLHHLCESLPAPRQTVQAWLPAALARVVGGAHKPLMADLTWLRAVEHYGNPGMQALGHPLLLPLLERVVTLDPTFAGAYVFLATAIDYAGPGYAAAMQLLARGMQQCPGAWRIAFFSGFNAYYYGHDYPRAAKDLAMAARAPQAPPHTAALATRLAAEAGLPEIGLQLVDTLLTQTQDPDAAEALKERRRPLQLDIQLRTLQGVVQNWTARHPGQHCHWDALIDAGMLREVPRDPWGTAFTLQHGKVASTHDARRLRLAPDAKGAARANG